MLSMTDPTVARDARDERYTRLAASVRRAQAGDCDAVRVVLQQIAPSVLCVTRRIMNDQPEAEDVAQDALIDLISDLSQVREPNAVVAYACRIAARRAIRAQRRTIQQQTMKQQMEVAQAEPPTTLDGQLAEDAVDRRQFALRLQWALAEIPPAQSESLIMRIVLGCSLPEVAAATGVGINTVRSRIRLAKQALAVLLGGASDGTVRDEDRSR